VNILAEKKQKKPVAKVEKKPIVSAKPQRRSPSMIEPYKPADVWMEFDRVFERFRRDFESILWPQERGFPSMGELETKIPSVDLEDKGDKFIMTAEVPGFKKDEVEISICGDLVEISGNKDTKKDEKTKAYVKQERSSESFYRAMTLPEEVKFEEVSADLKDGLLEITLPKKNPKPRKKINIK
jgi:HSP20 family protein